MADPLQPAGVVSDDPEQPAGLDAARLHVRTAGYCVLCDRIVERGDDGACARNPDHPAQAVSGTVILAEDEPVPQLPRFNVGAFLVPPVWGPAHGLWAGAIFLPMWLFMDSVIATAIGRGSASAAGGVAIVALTLGAQAWFAKRANGLAWRRVSDRVPIEEFARRERVWAVALVPVAALLIGWAVYYRLVLAG